MNENRVLYRIKNLEKLVARSLIGNCNLEALECRRIKNDPTPTQLQIIEYMISNCQENIYQKDLEDILNLRRATVSGVLQTMEKNGLLERVINSEDARAKRIILNEKARRIFLDKEKKIKDLEMVITKDIPNSDLEIFSRVLDKMQDNLKGIDTINK